MSQAGSIEIESSTDSGRSSIGSITLTHSVNTYEEDGDGQGYSARSSNAITTNTYAQDIAVEAGQSWINEAMILQQRMYRLYKDPEWDSIENNNLEVTLGKHIFGPPSQILDENNISDLGYAKHQIKVIKKTCSKFRKQIKNFQDHTFSLAPIFVCTEHGEFYTVFRLLKQDGTIVFIDTVSRVYIDWTDFEKNNKLPKGLCCYPVGGKYTGLGGMAQVDVSPTPASKFSSIFFRFCYILGGIIQILNAFVYLSVSLSETDYEYDDTVFAIVNVVLVMCQFGIIIRELYDKYRHY